MTCAFDSGLPMGSFDIFKIEAPNYELPSDSPGFEILHRSEISASFQVVDQIGSKYFPARYFVRDNDLWGINRLYGRNSIKIYHDGEYTHSDTPTMENSVSGWEQYRESISLLCLFQMQVGTKEVGVI
jgi:hypothetical protein